MKIKCVVINGAGGAGKDLFIEYCEAVLRHLSVACGNHSSVDPVKKAALLLGWDGVKDNKGRQFLSDLKALGTSAYDGPAQYMMGVIKEAEELYCTDVVLFFHIREPREIERFMEAVSGSISVLVHRDGIERFGNTSDRDVKEFPYTYHIDNNRDKAFLHLQAINFVTDLMKHWTTSNSF